MLNVLNFADTARLLSFGQKSRVQEYRIVHQRSQHIERVYQFHDNVAITIQDLGPQHSGLYLCKAGHSYRSVTMAVRDCSGEFSFATSCVVSFDLSIKKCAHAITAVRWYYLANQKGVARVK